MRALHLLPATQVDNTVKVLQDTGCQTVPWEVSTPVAPHSGMVDNLAEHVPGSLPMEDNDSCDSYSPSDELSSGE